MHVKAWRYAHACSILACTSSQSFRFTTFGWDGRQCSLLFGPDVFPPIRYSAALFISCSSCSYLLMFFRPKKNKGGKKNLGQASEANSESSLSLSHVEGIVAQCGTRKRTGFLRTLPSLRICTYCIALPKQVKHVKT